MVKFLQKMMIGSSLEQTGHVSTMAGTLDLAFPLIMDVGDVSSRATCFLILKQLSS